jgi:hypothetical protein
MGKRSLLAAALAILLTSVGCTRYWCEHHGYYPSAPAACQPCCVPCCPCAPASTGYAAPAWNAPAAAPATCCPPPVH